MLLNELIHDAVPNELTEPERIRAFMERCQIVIETRTPTILTEDIRDISQYKHQYKQKRAVSLLF
jgi:hypothetical protein